MCEEDFDDLCKNNDIKLPKFMESRCPKFNRRNMIDVVYTKFADCHKRLRTAFTTELKELFIQSKIRETPTCKEEYLFTIVSENMTNLSKFIGS